MVVRFSQTVLVLLLMLLAACAATGVESRSSSSVIPDEIERRLAIGQNRNTAKNVILFIGDGMGISTITAARIFEGQQLGQPGESHQTVLSKFPNVALVKTYNSNQQVPDSAGTSTAMHSGIKTRAGMLGVGPEAKRRDCEGALRNSVPTILEMAEQRGMLTGIVTTTRITHATPAAAYAHLPERNWESDRYLPREDWQRGCRDVAFQLAHFSHGDGIDIALGGGAREFYGSDANGRRLNSDADLVSEWQGKAPNRRFVQTTEELAAVKDDQQVLGLFGYTHLTYMAKRDARSTQPTLSEMAEFAVRRLESGPAGYYLLIEGGRIDLAHHEGTAGVALMETQEFFRAIQTVLDAVDLDETLVLVTADHSHTMTMAGYPTLGNPILGLVTTNDTSGEPNIEPALAGDGVPFSTLGYVNGPGAIATDSPRPSPETGLLAKQQSVYPLKWDKIDGSHSTSETHGGEDVALFGVGPWSHLIGGVMEQDLVFHIAAYAYGWNRSDM